MATFGFSYGKSAAEWNVLLYLWWLGVGFTPLRASRRTLTAIYFSELTQNASLLFFRKKINENIAEKICLKLKPEPNFAEKTLC